MEKLNHLRTNTDLKYHFNVIDYYQAIIENNSIFRSAVLVGSFAKGTPDRLSDIDLAIFVDEGDSKRAFSLLEENEPLNVLNKFCRESGEKIHFKKTIFDQFFGAEVFVIEKSSNFKLKKPYIVVCDKDNFLPNIIEEGLPPKHKDFDTLSDGSDDLALLDLLKWEIRGQKELVKHHLLKIAEEIK